MSWKTEVDEVVDALRRVPRMAPVDALILARCNLLPPQAVVFHVICELKLELNQKCYHYSKAYDVESPVEVDETQEDEFTHLHEKYLV